MAIVGDTCYCLGGTTGPSILTTKVYSVSLPDLISQRRELGEKQEQHQQIWKEIPALQTTRSVSFSFHGSLLAVGGMDEKGKAVTTILLYQPGTRRWVKVGDMPTPRYDCTCAMTDREMLVAGGLEDNEHLIAAVDISAHVEH